MPRQECWDRRRPPILTRRRRGNLPKRRSHGRTILPNRNPLMPKRFDVPTPFAPESRNRRRNSRRRENKSSPRSRKSGSSKRRRRKPRKARPGSRERVSQRSQPHLEQDAMGAWYSAGPLPDMGGASHRCKCSIAPLAPNTAPLYAGRAEGGLRASIYLSRSGKPGGWNGQGIRGGFRDRPRRFRRSR